MRKTSARQGWNAAQLASERPLSGRKALAPVGTPLSWLEKPLGDSACKHCGYHICCCTWNDPPRLQADSAPAALVNKIASCNAPNCCCDICWAELKSALLTYDQAVAACRRGKIVKGIDGLFKGMHFAYDADERRFGGSVDNKQWLDTNFSKHQAASRAGATFQVVP